MAPQPRPTGDWRDQAREFLPGMKRRSHKKENRWPRCMQRCLKLPWVAMLLAALAVAVVIVFIVFIAARPDSVQSSVQSDGKSVITVQCSTATSQLFCEQQIAEAAVNQDFQQAITETHLFTTLAMFVVATLVYFVIKAIRLRKKAWYLENRPRDSMQIWTDMEYWERAKRAPLHAEMERSYRLLKHLQTSDPQGPTGDLNYAHPTSEIAGTHLPRAMARSYVHLEAAAVAYDPLLQARPEQTVREYVTFLKMQCPRMDASVADAYVERYEQARFSDDAISESMWYECTSRLFILVEFFDSLAAIDGPMPAAARMRSPRSPATAKEMSPAAAASALAVSPSLAAAAAAAAAAHSRAGGGSMKQARRRNSLRRSGDDAVSSPTHQLFDGARLVRQRTLSI